MPIEDIPTLNDDQVKHIREYVFNTKAMIERNEDLTQLLREANLDYARVMNKLIFVNNLKRQDTFSQEFTVDLDEPIFIDTSKLEVPRYNKHAFLHCVPFTIYICIEYE